MRIRAARSFTSIIFSLFLISPARAQETGGRLTNLGPQITAAVIQGSMFLNDHSGMEMVYTVVRGNPAHLLGYRLSDHKLVTDQQLPGTDGAWDLAVSSDGWLYIPGAKGRLYRHLPGTQQVEDLGIVLPGETTIWNLAAGKNGEMFGATYPGCRVFRYHPQDGFTDAGKGPLVEGENYVRSLVYYSATGKLFAGVGSHADLIELDPADGSKRSILPAQFKGKEFVYGLEILEDLPGGDRLLALITGGSFTLVYNLKTHKFEYEIKEMDMKAVSQPDAEKRFYYTLRSGIYSRKVHQPETEPVKYAGDVGSANAMLLRNNHLYILNSDAEVIVMDVESKEVKRHKLTVPGQPIAIQSIMKGPDGRIWSGGYLAGGHAAYDPRTTGTVSYPGLHQTEGMTFKDKKIYFGIYPHGQYYEYDTEKTWDIRAGNPKFLGQFTGQSRSFAVLNETESGKIFFGMVPEYGRLGGDLVSYDTRSAELKTHGMLSQDQSVVSLAYANGLLWAGTSVSGGLGIRPSTEEAKLISWDVRKQEAITEQVPVPGAKAITAMIIGPDKNIWGMAGGTLFIFDPVQKKVLLTKVLYPSPPLISHVWRDAFLILHPSGMIYGTGNNQLFRIDPRNMEFQPLLSPASLLAMDDMGRIYFHRSAELWQYTPEGN